MEPHRRDLTAHRLEPATAGKGSGRAMVIGPYLRRGPANGKAVRAGERVEGAAAELTPGGPKDAASEAGKSVSSSPEGERTAPPSHEPPPVNIE